MLHTAWSRFRALPIWFQIVLWFFAWPFLLALFLWTWSRWDKAGKVAAILVFFFGSVTYAGAFVVPSAPPDNENAPQRSSISKPTPIGSSNRSDPSGIPPQAQMAKVTKHVDGDTLWVEAAAGGSLPLGASHKIRLLLIDTPEVFGGTDCYGPEASRFLASELPLGSSVFLLADREDKDQYDRFLRYLWKDDGEFFNVKAVALGFARAAPHPPNDAYIEQIRTAQSTAQAAKNGLWAACEVATNTTTPEPSNSVPPSGSGCHPSYPDVCIPPPPPDLDCGEITHSNFRVRWDVSSPDPHGFDGDKDGVGCESGGGGTASPPPPPPPSPSPTTVSGGDCHPSYPDFCITASSARSQLPGHEQEELHGQVGCPGSRSPRVRSRQGWNRL